MSKTTLKTCSGRFDVTLGKDSHARMQDALGWRVTATGGALWVTQDGDQRDVGLKTGESFAFDRPSALVSSLGAATAQFVQLDSAAVPHTTSHRVRNTGCIEAVMV
ncbi:MAG: DUF2917 domain-containing protein [Burkholderiaceae bacterium]|nr:DUF2917 domain-containing protein [Burkholderiaceae bacterium]